MKQSLINFVWDKNSPLVGNVLWSLVLLSGSVSLVISLYHIVIYFLK